MEVIHTETSLSSPINETLEIKIQDFGIAGKSQSESKGLGNFDQDFAVYFSASAWSNGYDEDTEGWLAVIPHVHIRGKNRPQNCVLSWIVRVIDAEGNARYPRSFALRLSKKYYDDTKYLARSFILSRADDFLPEGVLTLHCDISLEWYGVLPSSTRDNTRLRAERCLQFIKLRGESVSHEPETDPIHPATYIEFKSDILMGVCRDESGKMLAFCSSSTEENRDPSVWVFETRDESFHVLLDEQLDELGARLLKASPVIRRCVRAPMKEQGEKCIKLQAFDQRTFKNVVYFLMYDTLPQFEFDELLDVYKFSHMYEMKQLQQQCSKDMIEIESNLEELQEIADFYSDEYFSELLYFRRHENEDLERYLTNMRMDDKPYSDSYI